MASRPRICPAIFLALSFLGCRSQSTVPTTAPWPNDADRTGAIIDASANSDFFVSKLPFRDSKTITVELFEQINGQLHRREMDVSPGDQIGATGWTVVDIRQIVQNNDVQILVINDQGSRMIRSYRSDTHNPLRRKTNSPSPATRTVPTRPTPTPQSGS